jgi:hypothetical protein
VTLRAGPKIEGDRPIGGRLHEKWLLTEGLPDPLLAARKKQTLVLAEYRKQNTGIRIDGSWLKFFPFKLEVAARDPSAQNYPLTASNADF